MEHVSDEALVAGLGAGDRDAAVAFVRRFQPRVYGLARSVTADPGLAEDVAQEAFVRAWRRADTYDPRRGPVAPWLLTITRNLAIDTVRARSRRPEPPDDLLPLLASPEARPDERAEVRDEAERVQRALATLPTPQRRAVVLAVYGGRSARELGEIEGVPLGTAKTRIRSGMIRLRATLSMPQPGAPRGAPDERDEGGARGERER